ncbi:PREDICTED: uncharacterized protein LOC105961932 [Erythranthe guttata]|uniref:uncharacterized protein LOC105961932 n=1 Tax=Erythranthe guttata TaxID=4155 RepID=UPI00064D72FE|nr:PREDICTED: uncharacterized protein LOC105961932 [Erythranthe guttata]|eukprot:XP_012841647.1 PREDICTED: uncharacterized protein LOC105961932 [Erythranthe guttata]
MSKLEICGPPLVLKHLEIEFCSGLESLKVSVPSLTSLSVTSLKGFSLENVPMLVDVSVHIVDDNTLLDRLFHLLSCCISQLQTLHVSLDNEDISSAELDELWELPQMPKLKKLFIEYCVRGDKSLVRLAPVIRASPSLVEFVLHHNWYLYPREDRQQRNEYAIKIPHRHLKVFEFRGYYGCSNDAGLLGYILEYCVVLEKIIIDPWFKLGNNDLEIEEVEETARKTAKRELAPQVPQRIELVIL